MNNRVGRRENSGERRDVVAEKFYRQRLVRNLHGERAFRVGRRVLFFRRTFRFRLKHSESIQIAA